MTTASFDVLIVGAGHGGAQTAISLRKLGYTGSIGLFDADPEFPYERPPLSKDYLAGDKAFERIMIRPEAFWSEKAIALRRGTRVSEVDPQSGTVTCTDGTRYMYGKLVWATGATARKLSCEGADSGNVHTIRSRAEIDAIMTALVEPGRRVAIVGAGYIGLEAAAVMRKLGHQPTVIEVQDRVLSRVAGRETAAYIESLHRANGVNLRLGVGLVRIVGQDGRAEAVELDSGEVLPCDMIVTGIGIMPSVGPLEEGGADCPNGVRVDAFCRTSLPDIYAIGDCALHTNAFAQGAAIRLESVQNANDMATVVAQHIAGAETEYDAMPWFWSNQYDTRLQTVGLLTDYDREVVRGDPATGSFSVAYLREGKLIAMDCVNAVKDFVQVRKLIEAGSEVDPERLCDPAVPLKDMVEA